MDAERRNWLVVLGLIIGVPALLVWGCNALANDAAERAAEPSPDYSRIVDEAVRATLTGQTREAVTRIRPTPTVETTLEDVTVWRFCSGIIAGTLTQDQMLAVYHLNETQLSKDREEKLAVVRLLRDQVHRGMGGSAFGKTEVLEMQAACQEVRRVDWQRSRYRQ